MDIVWRYHEMKKLEYVVCSLSRGTKEKYENYVINAIYQKVNDSNLIIETQKEIRLSNHYRPLMDLYLPQLDIAVEVDEGYHSREDQKEHDIWREESIVSEIQGTCLGRRILFVRVKCYGVTLEELNRRIDEVVQIIKDRISSRSAPLIWKSHQEILEDIRKRGTIEEDDVFDTNHEIINLVYGKSLRGWQKAMYHLLWFPVMSEKEEDELTSRATWQNFFNDSQSIIYERSVDSNRNADKKDWARKDEESRTLRIVFVKDRDTFGKSRKRFAGVYRASGWDDNMNAQIWKRVASEIRIPLKEEDWNNG